MIVLKWGKEWVIFEKDDNCQTGATTVSFMTDPPFVTQRALQSLWCVNHHVFIFIVIFGSPAVDAPSRNLIILCPIRWSQFTTLTSNTTKVIKETKNENSNNKQKKMKVRLPVLMHLLSSSHEERQCYVKEPEKPWISYHHSLFSFHEYKKENKNDKMFLATHQDERRRRGQSPHG